MMFRVLLLLTISALLLATGSTTARSADAATTCAEIAGKNRKFHSVWKMAPFATAIVLLEQQGKGKITPAYAEPKSSCVVETFQSNGYTATAAYAGFQPGELTLLYKFTAQKDGEEREVLVVYNGMLSLLQEDGRYFYVTETRGGRTGFYAMYREEPSYAALKQLVEGILSDSVKPPLAVDWPADSDELIVHAIDVNRLTD